MMPDEHNSTGHTSKKTRIFADETQVGMKRTFLLLLMTLVALYAKVAYEVWTEDAYLTSSPKGYLSDIAQSVTAIPLQSAGKCEIEKTRSIRKEGNNLFLVSKDILYRFDTSGQFVCQVTRPDVIRVAAYVIDPLRELLIVLGNADDIHYYTFDGEPAGQKKAATHIGGRIRAIAMYQDCIWTIEERAGAGSYGQEKYIEQKMVRYDVSFHEMESRRLITVDLPDKPIVPLLGNVNIAVAEDTGTLYAHAAPSLPERLLRDSLLLKYKQISSGIFPDGDDCTVSPLCFGRRFWLASLYDPDDASRTYAFCFDRETNRSWQVEGGFEDDFYNTGLIPEWQAMDVFSRAYSFCKSGEAVKHIAPSGEPVVFIVELKV
jgi:hypothetical protein